MCGADSNSAEAEFVQIPRKSSLIVSSVCPLIIKTVACGGALTKVLPSVVTVVSPLVQSLVEFATNNK